ncbi:MAG: hypothetical protein ABI728_03205, partial [Betaproteobacteria bacterium]
MYKSIGLVLSIFPVFAFNSFAHNIDQKTSAVRNPDPDAQLVKALQVNEQFKAALFSIIRRERIWTKDKVTVCFGPRQATLDRKEHVASIVLVATEWMSAGDKIQLDFGGAKYRVCANTKSADIRVEIAGLDTPVDEAVAQSLTGNEAATSDVPYSMQLIFPPGSKHYQRPEVFRFYVLHEFGHALGAEHEHQRKDCKFDYGYIAKHFNLGNAQETKEKLRNIFGYRASAYPDAGAAIDSQFISTKFDN